MVGEGIDRAAHQRGEQQVVGRPAFGRGDLGAAGDGHPAAAIDLDRILEDLRPRDRHGATLCRPTPVLGFGPMRLRTLSEAECYARCYGGLSDERVTVLRL